MAISLERCEMGKVPECPKLAGTVRGYRHSVEDFRFIPTYIVSRFIVVSLSYYKTVSFEVQLSRLPDYA